MSSQQSSTPQFYYGIVKQVISGDSVVIAKPGHPPQKERTVGLSNIVAPKLARRVFPPVKELSAKESNVKDSNLTDLNVKDSNVKDSIARDSTVKDSNAKDSTDSTTKDLTAIDPQSVKDSNIKDIKETKDEPFAWEAREFLRKKLVGKEVRFTIDNENKNAKENKIATENNPKEYGSIYIGKDITGENITDSLVSEGLVDLRKAGAKPSEAYLKLCDLEEIAKSNCRGKFGPNLALHVRDITWNVENTRNLVDLLNKKPVKAVVEHVRDGSTVKVLLLPDELKPGYHSIYVMLSGIRCPPVLPNEKNCEPFAVEAKYFTEYRLLQRDVEVILESGHNQNFLGTLLHPNGNITELLLSEGYAKCVDWSLQCVTSGIEKLRAAERRAKDKRLRLWKDFTSSGPVINAKEKEFQAKVVEVINADSMNVKLIDGSVKKIFLSSIRPPRFDPNQEVAKDKARRTLYDIPYMFEAKDFLRKKLIGKRVNVTIDYKQPARDSYPEKICCTVTIGEVNVAEALISKGLAKTIRYRADDDQRSSHYDELLTAETKAEKSGKGLHCKKDVPVHRIVDLSGDLQKSKQFLPFFKRAGRMDAVVEFVTSGSRLRVFVPRENCLITFLLGGITCLRASRDTKSGMLPGDPHGDEALAFTKDLCMQREVQIEVESSDKAGNFIGWLWIENANLSEALVREGYAEVYHQSAQQTPYYRSLQLAQEDAQKRKAKMWKSYEIKEIDPKVEEKIERVVNYKTVVVTDVRFDLTFYAQHVEDGPKLEEMTQNMRQEFTSNEPLPGAYTPKKGDLCAALFADDSLWYRAKVDKVQENQVHVTFIDYGNKEKTKVTNLASLPSAYQSLPAAAHEYNLAFIKVPSDTDNANDARNAFFEETNNKMLLLNVEYRNGPALSVTLLTSEEKQDIGKELVQKGFVSVDVKREKRFQKVIADFISAQEVAKKSRLNLWQYGDITDDDAKEFG